MSINNNNNVNLDDVLAPLSIMTNSSTLSNSSKVSSKSSKFPSSSIVYPSKPTIAKKYQNRFKIFYLSIYQFLYLCT
jgi:hypothetical protein